MTARGSALACRDVGDIPEPVFFFLKMREAWVHVPLEPVAELWRLKNTQTDVQMCTVGILR